MLWSFIGYLVIGIIIWFISTTPKVVKAFYERTGDIPKMDSFQVFITITFWPFILTVAVYSFYIEYKKEN